MRTSPLKILSGVGHAVAEALEQLRIRGFDSRGARAGCEVQIVVVACNSRRVSLDDVPRFRRGVSPGYVAATVPGAERSPRLCASSRCFSRVFQRRTMRRAFAVYTTGGRASPHRLAMRSHDRSGVRTARRWKRGVEQRSVAASSTRSAAARFARTCSRLADSGIAITSGVRSSHASATCAGVACRGRAAIAASLRFRSSAPCPERRVRHHGHPPLAHPGQQIPFDAALAEVIENLVGRAMTPFGQRDELRACLARSKLDTPQRTILPCRAQPLERVDRLGERNAAGPMQQIEIEAIGAQSPQTALAGSNRRFSARVVRIHLAHYKTLVAPAGDGARRRFPPRRRRRTSRRCRRASCRGRGRARAPRLRAQRSPCARPSATCPVRASGRRARPEDAAVAMPSAATHGCAEGRERSRSRGL